MSDNDQPPLDEAGKLGYLFESAIEEFSAWKRQPERHSINDYSLFLKIMCWLRFATESRAPAVLRLWFDSMHLLRITRIECILTWAYEVLVEVSNMRPLIDIVGKHGGFGALLLDYKRGGKFIKCHPRNRDAVLTILTRLAIHICEQFPEFTIPILLEHNVTQTIQETMQAELIPSPFRSQVSQRYLALRQLMQRIEDDEEVPRPLRVQQLRRPRQYVLTRPELRPVEKQKTECLQPIQEIFKEEPEPTAAPFSHKNYVTLQSKRLYQAYEQHMQERKIQANLRRGTERRKRPGESSSPSPLHYEAQENFDYGELLENFPYNSELEPLLHELERTGFKYRPQEDLEHSKETYPRRLQIYYDKEIARHQQGFIPTTHLSATQGQALRLEVENFRMTRIRETKEQEIQESPVVSHGGYDASPLSRGQHSTPKAPEPSHEPQQSSGHPDAEQLPDRSESPDALKKSSEGGLISSDNSEIPDPGSELSGVDEEGTESLEDFASELLEKLQLFEQSQEYLNRLECGTQDQEDVEKNQDQRYQPEGKMQQPSDSQQQLLADGSDSLETAAEKLEQQMRDSPEELFGKVESSLPTNPMRLGRRKYSKLALWQLPCEQVIQTQMKRGNLHLPQEMRGAFQNRG